MQARTVIVKYNKKLEFVLTIKSKVTILRGDSATGKTTLIDNVGINRKNLNNKGIVVYNPRSNVDVMTFARSLDRNTIVFFDEDAVKLLVKDKILNKLWHMPLYFIFATRKRLYCIDYSYTDCYVMKTKNNLCEALRETRSFGKLPKDTHYVCEDSNSGFQYFSDRLQSVLTMHGVRNCVKFANKGTLILDGAASGKYIAKLQYLKAKLYLPPSFEWLLLKHYTGRKASEFLELYTADFLTMEQFYTSLCISGFLPFKYTKSKLPVSVFKEILIPELEGTSSKYWSKIASTQYLPNICDKYDAKDCLNLLLQDMGKSKYFKKVFTLLPDTLDPDAFYNTVKSCLEIIED